MVNALTRRLPLLALAALIGAVGIERRRPSPPERRDESAPAPQPSAPAPSAPAPSPAPERVRIAPRVEAPRPAPGRVFVPSAPASPSTAEGEGGRSRVHIAPRRVDPAPGFAPSATAPAASIAGERVRIQRREGIETVPRRHYWHGSGRGRYSHYYDGRVHWYGHPHGASFVWMRPYGGLWWTWDARFSRWTYWNDGFWWWHGPGGVQYVFVDNDYYPYDTIRRAPAAASAPSGDGRGVWTSPDGRRLVEVTGSDDEALLYDKSTSPPAYVRFLGKDVQKVRFSSGAPPTILVEFRGGSFALFDYDGRRLDTAAPAGVKAAPPASELPPPPPDELPSPP